MNIRKRVLSIILSISISLQIFAPFSMATALDSNDLEQKIFEITMIHENTSNVDFESLWFSDTYRYLYVDNVVEKTIVITSYNDYLEILFNDKVSIYKKDIYIGIDDFDFSNIEAYTSLKNQVINGEIALEHVQTLPKESTQPTTRSYSGAFDYYKANVPSAFLDIYVGSSSYNGRTGYVYENMYHSFEDLGTQTFGSNVTLSFLITVLGIVEPKLKSLGFVFKFLNGIQVLSQPYTIVRYRGNQNFVRDVTIDGVIRYAEGKNIRHYVYSGYNYEMTQYMTTQDANYNSVYGLVREAVINIGW